MKPPATETLWAYARGELSPEEAAQVRAQLEASAEGRAALADVEAALGVLSSLPAPPAMPEAMARRVGEKLAEAADREAARSLTGWWRSLLSWRVVVPLAAAAAVVAVVATKSVEPSGPGAQPVVEGPLLPPPEVVPPSDVPRPSGPVPVKAKVASARNARRTGASALTEAQVLEAGSKVSTAAGGSLWLELPDGTKAGLTAATDVTLATLERNALSFDVERGSLAMVVPHREDRLLTVRAGDVEVRDLGTRFLVSRDERRVVVAVEEGSVEVKTPGATRVVKAGRAVTWQQNALDERPWPAVSAKPPRESNGSPPAAPDTGPSSGGLAEAPKPVEPAAAAEDPADVEPPASGNPEDEWAPPPTGLTPEPVGLPPPNGPPAQVVTVQPKPKRRSPGFSLKAVEEHLRDLEREAAVPFTPLNAATREGAVRTISRLADAQDYERALALAETWLQAPPSPSPQEPAWRRAVLQQKLRCLNRLGRLDEAMEVERLLGR